MKKILFIFSFFVFAITANAQNKWSVSNNYSKSDGGQLLISLPVQAALNCIVNAVGKPKTFSLRNDSPKELEPGNYDVIFWGIKIPSVTVEKRKDTRIFAGVLNSTVKGLWEVWTTDSVKIYSAGGPKQVALPVGNYIVKTGGAEIKTTITDGKVSIFSFTRY